MPLIATSQDIRDLTMTLFSVAAVHHAQQRDAAVHQNVLDLIHRLDTGGEIRIGEWGVITTIFNQYHGTKRSSYELKIAFDRLFDLDWPSQRHQCIADILGTVEEPMPEYMDAIINGLSTYEIMPEHIDWLLTVTDRFVDASTLLTFISGHSRPMSDKEVRAYDNP